LKQLAASIMNRHAVSEITQKILRGDRMALSKAITMAESSLSRHHDEALQIIDEILPYTGNSIRIGITGVPGAGKSTFIDKLGLHLCNLNHRVAVLAIDPSSALSKGSILADKTRMHQLAVHPNAYIRPSPSGERLGGVARATREIILLCEAAGFNIIIVETVGVGQSEITVKNLTDFFLLLMLAGAGDELQGMKRGIMEMADLILINKADGDNIEKAKHAARLFNQVLHLLPAKENGWEVKANTCSALNGEGIKETWAIIQHFEKEMKTSGYFEKNRKQQLVIAFHELLKEQVWQYFISKKNVRLKIFRSEQQIAENKINVYRAVQQILNEI
jgi:LAO/AO transport system kinase